MTDPSLLQRLKERKLVQWALAYLAGAWVLVEASNLAVERFHLPEVIGQAAFVIAFFGFLLTLVLAWYHGERGRQRVSGPELLMVAALLVVAGVALTTLESPRELIPDVHPRERDARPTLAVLPLENLSPDPRHGFFAAGVQEDLTAKLQRISTVAVISRTSVERYREPANRPPLREIASELGADYLLEGSARVGRDSVRITVQLIEGETDVHIWADTYDCPYSVEDYVRLQAEVVQRIASDLRVPISPEDLAWLEAIPTASLQAYEAYMRGNEAFLVDRQQGSLVPANPAIRAFEEAVALDPGFSQARAALALSLTYTVRDPSRLERARRAAERALSHGFEIPEARLALQRYYSANGDSEEAGRQLEMAAQVAPDHPLVIRSLAGEQAERGQFDAAIETLDRGERLDPGDPLLPNRLASVYTYLHRFDDALLALDREAARSESSPPSGLRDRTRIYLMRGDTMRARVTISEILELMAHDGRHTPYTVIATSLNRVILRHMSPEQRDQAFDAFAAWWPSRGMPLSCTRVLH
jgi:serine/threonine-protein kinase